jgi:hypothetical protein
MRAAHGLVSVPLGSKLETAVSICSIMLNALLAEIASPKLIVGLWLLQMVIVALTSHLTMFTSTLLYGGLALTYQSVMWPVCTQLRTLAQTEIFDPLFAAE